MSSQNQGRRTAGVVCLLRHYRRTRRSSAPVGCVAVRGRCQPSLKAAWRSSVGCVHHGQWPAPSITTTSPRGTSAATCSTGQAGRTFFGANDREVPSGKVGKAAEQLRLLDVLPPRCQCGCLRLGVEAEGRLGPLVSSSRPPGSVGAVPFTIILDTRWGDGEHGTRVPWALERVG